MSSSTGSGRKRTTSRQCSAEDQALNQIAKEAENRLAARRAARAEARDIRMRELEKQQKEADEREKQNENGGGARVVAPSSVNSSRRGSDDSSSAGGDDNYREIKRELSELADKYKKAMVSNAQLDNEKQTFRYEVELLKDKLEEMEEQCIEVSREHRDRCRELEQKKRDYSDLHDEGEYYKQQLELRDKLIKDYGLVFISNDAQEEEEKAKDKKKKKRKKKKAAAEAGTAALVTPDALEVLKRVEGSLDEKLKSFSDEKAQLAAEIKRLKHELEEEKEKSALAQKYSSPRHDKSGRLNGPGDVEAYDSQTDMQKQLTDYRLKCKKAEQDITTLEGIVARLESQTRRFREAAEESEKNEEELKIEKRKLQRELRELQSDMEELQSQNQHLQKRLEKLKSARNALLKS